MKSMLKYGCAAAALLVAQSLFATGEARAQREVSEGKWSPHAEVRGRVGSDATGGVNLFVPVWQDPDSMVFGDLRLTTGLDDDGRTHVEGNAGLGYRTQVSEEWIFGGYGFVDVRESEFDNTFWQFTVGAEMLSEDWDIRANGYIPEDDEKAAPAANAAFLQGNSIIVRAGEERALYGFDGEVGYRLASWGQEQNSELRAFVGGYYFDAAEVDEIAGPRARAELRFYDVPGLPVGSRVTLGAEVQHDDVRETEGFALVGLRIPLGFGRREPLAGLDRRMDDTVVRDWDIVTRAEPTGRPEQARFEDGRKVGDVRFADRKTGGDTLTPANAGDLADAVDNAGADGVVVALRQTGVIETAGQGLRPGQVLMGGGAGLPVTTSAGTNAVFRAPGGRGTIRGGAFARRGIGGQGGPMGPAAVIYMADDSQVIGVNVVNTYVGDRGGQSSVISARGVSNVTVRDATVTAGVEGGPIGLGQNSGIEFDGVTGGRILDNEVTVRGGAGIGILAGGSDIEISGNMVRTGQGGGAGILVGAGRIANAAGMAAPLAGITITGNTVVASGDGSGGIVAFTDGTAPVTISGNDVTMRGEGSFGIFVAADFFGIPPGPGPGPGPGPILTLVASEIGSPGITRITGNTVTLGGANSVGIVGMGGLGFPDTVVGANAVPLTGGVIRDNTVLTSLESQTGFGLTSGGMTGDNNTESGPGTACIDLVGGNDVFVNGRRCRVQPPR